MGFAVNLLGLLTDSCCTSLEDSTRNCLTYRRYSQHSFSVGHTNSVEPTFVGVSMEFEVPKRHISGLHYPLTWFNGFYNDRGRRDVMIAKGKGPWQNNIFIINLG